MSKEVVQRWMPSDLGELITALQEIQEATQIEGHDDSTVYVDCRDLTLERATLTDGSTVMNVIVRENR